MRLTGFILCEEALEMPVVTAENGAEQGTANGGAIPGKRILIAEDNEADARILGHKLMESGYPCEVEYTNTLHKTIKRCERDCPDLIFLDLGMPPASGVEALEAVRSVCPHLAVVVVTGSDDNELRVKSAKTGAFGYITKSNLDVWRVLSAVYAATNWEERVEREKEYAVYLERMAGLAREHTKAIEGLEIIKSQIHEVRQMLLKEIEKKGSE